jgi:hypothetical protein
LARNGWRVSIHAGLRGYWPSYLVFPHIKSKLKKFFFFKRKKKKEKRKKKKDEKSVLIYKSLLIDIYIWVAKPVPPRR